MIQKNIVKILSMTFIGLLLGVTLNIVPVLAKRIAIQAALASATTSPPVIIMAANPSISQNWSGYSAASGTFTGVGGSWIVPNSNGSKTSADATWVGIGGVTGRDLIQAGTQTILTNGQSNYQAWYELLPAGIHAVPLNIKPGDSITISLSKQPADTWTISFRNNTSKENYQVNVIYNSSLSSAEWIEEAPSMGRSVIPLDNFGSIQFSDLWAVKNAIKVTPAQADAKPINMVNGLRQVISQSSILANNGTSFAVNRTTTSASQTAVAFSTRGRWNRTGSVYAFRSPHGYNYYNGLFLGK